MRRFLEVLTRTFLKWSFSAVVFATVAIGIGLCGVEANGQSGAGSIQGTVTDSTGAVLPGASITVINEATNATFNTKSNETGYYQVPALFTGNYVVTVRAPGMKTYKTSIELLVAQNAVINPVMTAGAVTQQIEVNADTVELTTTDNGSISSTLENQRINQLPMNGRMLLTLVGATTAGVEGSGQRINGLMGEALEYVADGVPLTNRQFGGEGGTASANFSGQSQTPDPDAVQEVRLVTNASAQYSQPGTVVVTTKSGTNTFHGTLFETARNNAIGIARARQNPSNFTAPHYVRNEYGVSAGGPIEIPHLYHGKDKSFWFLAYEKYSLASYSYELTTVPTTAMRGGDFSGLVNSARVLQVLYDPATTQSAANNYARTPFQNNQIPINRLSPTAKILFDITPLPSLTANPLVQSNLQTKNYSNQFIPTWTFRIDHDFNESNRAYLRYTGLQQTLNRLRNIGGNVPATIAADGIPAQVNGAIDNPDATFAAGLGYTHVFSPTFFAETVIGQQWFSQFYSGGGTPANYESKLGLPNNFGESGFPSIGTNLITPYNGTQFGYGENQIIDNIDENLTKIMGKHQMNFGGRYRHERFGYLIQQSADSVSFSNLATGIYLPSSGANYSAASNTGYPDADMFLGAASSYSVNTAPIYAHYHDMEFDAYFQDDYHVSRNLTANLGLRWEAHPAAWTKDGLMNSFDYKNDAMVLATPPATLISEGYTTQAIITNMQNIGAVYETPAQAGMPANTLMRNYMLTFSPRIGLAYQLFGGKHGTVLRGAYGRYIYPEPIRSYMQGHQGINPIVVNYSQSYTAANQSPDGLPNYLLRNPQSVIMGINSSNVVNSTSSTAILPGVTNFANSPAMPPDYVTQVNFTIEQALKGNSAFRITYLWNHGSNLDHYYSINNHPSTFVWEMAYGIAPPTGTTIGSNQYAATATGPYDQKTWGANSWEVKNGWSNDNALQVSFQRYYHRGIAYQINYAWSKPMRFGGNWNRDSTVDPSANYLGVLGAAGSWSSPYGTTIAPSLPPAPPTGTLSWQEYHQLDRFEGYMVDTAIPKHHITFNGVIDLPFGRGKRFLGNASRFMEELVGGFQLAGDGSILSQDFAVTNTNWGPTNPLKIYKHNAKITDCRSGACLEAFEWFNGYLAPTVINTATGGVSGLPSNWAPYQTPVDTTPPPDPSKSCTQQVCTPTQANYGTNNVVVNLSNGKPATVPFSPGPLGSNPYSRTVLNGPINYTVDLSVFKVFLITESMRLRFNVDAFNALNVQGYNNPSGTDGTENMTSSYNTPRQLQFTLRLQF